MNKTQRAATFARIAAKRRFHLDALVAKMHADYQRPMSLAALGKKYGRDRRCIGELFVRRGLAIRPVAYEIKRLGNGQIQPADPLTQREISALISSAKKIRIPEALRREWREWPMERRRDFIARIRARSKLDNEQPTTPFSAGIEPFAYGSPRAHAIADRMNAGCDSRHAAVMIRLCSQGVIYKNRLFFWSKSSGPAYFIGPWSPRTGRPPLHHIIWEEHNGPVPAGHAVRHADGNRNNFHPANLVLATRNDVCRENQAKSLLRKSRAATALLLNRTQQKKSHAHTNILTKLRTTAR